MNFLSYLAIAALISAVFIATLIFAPEIGAWFRGDEAKLKAAVEAKIEEDEATLYKVAKSKETEAVADIQKAL